MILTRYRLLNWFFMGVLLTVACGMQSSIWYQWTGGAPAPQIWLIIFLHLTLYRPFIPALVGIYVLTATIIRSYSLAPVGMLWLVLFVCVSATSYIKGRMFWSTSRYFVMAAAAFSFLYHAAYVLLSLAFESNSASLNILTRLSEILLTTLSAYPLFWLLQAMDRWTLRQIASKGAPE